MIDFRYHLVSLVAVFLALAVGIVLGAGPLKDPIGATLTESVKQLRSDQAALSQQLSTARAGLDNRDAFITRIEPALVADQLGGRSVVVVTLPGADNDAVKPVSDAITAAGAKITGRIDVQGAWVDPADRIARNQAVEQLRATVAGTSGASSAAASRSAASSGAAAGSGSNAGSPSGGSHRSASPTATSAGSASTSATEAEAAQLLARALLTTEVSGSGRTDQTERTLLDGLSKAGLIDVNGDTPGRATQAVVIAPGVVQAVDGAVPSPSPSPTADALSAWVALARALDAASTGAVVAGPASSTSAGGVLAAMRAQPQITGGVSTVDTGGTPMGDVTVVFALREQQLGGAGNYGFSDGAKAAMPAAATSSG
jgi:Copper transport outer membrane protein, MctB